MEQTAARERHAGNKSIGTKWWPPALFLALGAVLVCLGSSPGVLECRPASRSALRGVPPPATLTAHEPRPGECVRRSQLAVVDQVLEWAVPSWHAHLRNVSVVRFPTTALNSAESDGPVVLVLLDADGKESRLPLHPPWTMSSRYGNSIARRVNDHLGMLRSSDTGFLYTEQSNALFVSYGLFLIGLGLLLPCMHIYRRIRQ